MMNESIQGLNIQLFILPFTEALCIPIRINIPVVLYHTDLISVPPRCDSDIIVRTIKMTVTKKKSIYPGIIFILLHGLSDLFISILMQNFISLDIETPVCIR